MYLKEGKELDELQFNGWNYDKTEFYIFSS